MAGGIRLEGCRPKTIICEYKAGGLVRVLDSEDVVLPAHPTGGVQDLFGFIAKIKGKNPVIRTTAWVGVSLPARQGQELLLHIFITAEPWMRFLEHQSQSFPKGAERDE